MRLPLLVQGGAHHRPDDRDRRRLAAGSALATFKVLLVDNVGILTDPDRLSHEWRRLLGEFFSARVGGSAQAWADANIPAFAAWLDSWRRAQETGAPVREFKPAADRAWMEALAAAAGRPVPQPAEDWARDAYRYVSERVDAAIPGAVTKLRQIADRGVEMHTASSNFSADIDGYLRQMGVRDLFGKTFGVDLVDQWKNGPVFYTTILADIGRDAGEAVVVDDQERPRRWAEAAGVRAVPSLSDALAALT